MILSSYYSDITALFEDPGTQGETQESGHPTLHVSSTFTVASLEYQVNFDGLDPRGDSYEVSFEPIKIHGTPEQVVTFLSRILHKPVSVDDIPRVQRKVLHSLDILGTGNASKVLGGVIAAIREFIVNYDPSQLIIAAVEDSRVSLYRSMIKRLLPQAQIRERDHDGIKEFVIQIPWNTR